MVEDRLSRPQPNDVVPVIRLVVLVGLVADEVSSVIAAASGVSEHRPTGFVGDLQSLLTVGAVAACLWGRPRLTIVLSAITVALGFWLGPTGTELLLLLVTAVALAATASGRLIALGAAAQFGYAVAFGLAAERERAGVGWPAALGNLAFSGVGFAVGGLARRLLRARDALREKVRKLQGENAQIRARERGRLADDLQSAVISSLAEIDRVVVAVDRSAGTGVLRRALGEVDNRSRSLAAELRALLEVLRLDTDSRHAGPPPAGATQRARVGRVVRWVLTGGCVLLGGVVLLDLSVGSPLVGQALIQALTLGAGAVALWWPRVGVAAAAAILVLAPFVEPFGSWDVLPAALVCLIVSFELGPRGLWAVASGLGLYGVLLRVGTVEDPFLRFVAVGYVAVLAVITGLLARHLVHARQSSKAEVVDLLDERDRIEAQERGAVARELHDVVAHQLSVANLLVMATSASQDAAVLRATLAKIGRSAETARHELAALLATMRGSAGGGADPGSLVNLRSTLDTLGTRLHDQGYRMVVALDPAADHLDSTTRRTLNRIVQEATTNILRYAPPGSVCGYSLQVDGQVVDLEVSSSNPSPGKISDLSLGWGLRGIRERVELLHGTFHAGQQRDQWVLSARLPIIDGARFTAAEAVA